MEYFALYGGIGRELEFDFFDGVQESVQRHFVREFGRSAEYLEPGYLREDPYRRLLTALARGDGKMLGAFRRAGLSESAGGAVLHRLVEAGTLRLEHSREAPVRPVPGRPIRKELRGYRIQDKVRFVRPFDRFWFGFVEPFASRLERGEEGEFLEYFLRHRERAGSLIFEQLSNDLLARRFADSDPLLSRGSHWDYRNEFDLLAVTRSGRIIVGECKYSGRPVCGGELKKLREKAEASGIRADRFALFARSGFSRELREHPPSDLMLFELEDYRELLEE